MYVPFSFFLAHSLTHSYWSFASQVCLYLYNNICMYVWMYVCVMVCKYFFRVSVYSYMEFSIWFWNYFSLLQDLSTLILMLILTIHIHNKKNLYFTRRRYNFSFLWYKQFFPDYFCLIHLMNQPHQWTKKTINNFLWCRNFYPTFEHI